MKKEWITFTIDGVRHEGWAYGEGGVLPKWGSCKKIPASQSKTKRNPTTEDLKNYQWKHYPSPTVVREIIK